MRTRPAILLAPLALACLGAGPDDPPRATSSAAAPATKAAEERPEDAKAIRALGKAFTQAYDKGDAKALASLFTDHAEVTNEAGATVRGREAIAAHFAAAFEENPGEKLELTSEAIHFLGPDVARETGLARTIPAGGGAPETTRYSTLLIRRDGRWLQATVHEYPEQAPTAHDRLKELEWLVGEWVDESDEAVVHTTCQWSKDGNFLLRDFSLQVGGQPAMTGTQRIGWDPSTGQFKSWVFDSDGGHSEGLWSRSGNDQWVIKASGVMADGQIVSATQVLTFVNKGMARWRSVDRTVAGQAAPDLPEIVLVRTPPKPSAPAAPRSTTSSPARKP